MKDNRNAGRTFSCACKKKAEHPPQGILPLDVMEVKTTFASSIMED